jgi:hypothetical protein
MHDPFPIPKIKWLSDAVQPFSDLVGFTTLPLHIHEVVGSFLAYTFINMVVAPKLSRMLFPTKYSKLSLERKINWDVHVVSLVQSVTINTLALWVMFTDKERKHMEWHERVWGYTGAAGMIQGMATGYFIWDLMVTLQHLSVFGFGSLAHAVSALLVFSFGFRPFVNFYGCTFILYELSTPFVNFHWFFDKLDMTGSKPQLYNGITLLFMFFSCRLVWGTYQSVRVYQDVWQAIHHNPTFTQLNNNTIAMNATLGADNIMRFSSDSPFVPLWLAFTYLGSNLVLNTLNFYWFGKMIEAVRKRFQPPKEKRPREKAHAVRSTGTNGTAKVGANETEIRRRTNGVVSDEDESVNAIS